MGAYETLDYSSILTRLVVREDFIVHLSGCQNLFRGLHLSPEEGSTEA
jgi:hypothetical protein